MSFNVLIIPEDATNDHYLLKPILSALLTRAGFAHAKVRVLMDPAAQGVEQAMRHEFLQEVAGRYPMVDLFLLCVDRDAELGREAALNERETTLQASLGERRLLGVAAHQEVETWCLAAMTDLPPTWSWTAIRAERDCKERYFDIYSRQRGLLDAPGDGREILGREAGRAYQRIRSRCSEVERLQHRI